jgi:hypothetical protein
LTTHNWRFIELEGGMWAWEARDPDSSLGRFGIFDTLEACFKDALDHGFHEDTRDRRKEQRSMLNGPELAAETGRRPRHWSGH